MSRMMNVLLCAAFFPFLLADGPAGNPASITSRSDAKPGPPPFVSQTFDDLSDFHRIVILWDGGRPMLNKMNVLKYQLSTTFDHLSAGQSFNLICMQDKKFNAIGKELLPATPENKKKAVAYIENLTPAATTDPIPGLEEAFRENPDVIYLLDDSDFPDNASVVKTINQLNNEKKTKIYTIAFLGNADVDAGFIALFKKIAADGNGKFKQVDTEKLDLPAEKPAMFDDLDKFHRIMFLIDGGGGSMINKAASLKEQLDKAAGSLSREQAFNIIYFPGANGDLLGRELLPATGEHKNKASVFLEGVTSPGTYDPLRALPEVFREKPDVIYLLTDGDFPDNDAMLKKFRELNKDKAVKVYTIAFVNKYDTDSAFIDLLKTLATESGEKYKKVDEDKLYEQAAPPNEKPAPAATQSAKQDAGPVSMFPECANVQSVVFVCDAGTMFKTLAPLKDQLIKAVTALTAKQSFNIIFMADKSADEFDRKLVPAGPDRQREVMKFLDGIASPATTDPIPSLESAFKQSPEVIYLIADGDFPDNDFVLRKIRELNKDKKVKVYTIAFLNQADTEPAFIDLLKTIASESGGKFRRVDAGKL